MCESKRSLTRFPGVRVRLCPRGGEARREKGRDGV